MAEPKPKKIKRRIFSSWITSMVSISLVLVLLGTLSLVLINARQLSEYVKEKIGFTLVLHDNIKEVEIIRVQKLINATDYVKSTRVIDKETAAKELSSELGEDFMGFLGYNPLFSSIEVKLFAQYTNTNSLAIIEKELMEYPQIKEVYYQENLVSIINQNIKKISFLLLLISGLLGFIFVSLINNTIRISIYAERFSINTMQMVGATNNLIRKPFIQRSVFWGIYGALIANIIITGSIYAYKKELYGIITLTDLTTVGIVFVLVLFLGISISWLSTYFAVNKFLRMKFDELFY